MRVWSYVITTDRGSAPNYDGPAVTLAICKPRIRKRARPGDLLLGFNGSRLSKKPHSLRWAGIIAEVMPLGAYWDDLRFRKKRPKHSATPDNIYRQTDGSLSQETNSSHDQGNVVTDIRGENALIFSNAWHFGSQAPELEEDFGLRVPMNGRRCEPLNEIPDLLWVELKAMLDAHDCGLPLTADGGSPSCKPRSIGRGKGCKPSRPRRC